MERKRELLVTSRDKEDWDRQLSDSSDGSEDNVGYFFLWPVLSFSDMHLDTNN